MRIIETKKAPGAIDPYSYPFEARGFVTTSGQIPVAPKTGLVPDDIEKQTHQSCKNVAAILETTGTSLEKSRQDHLFFGGYEGLCRL
jgi:2-iminobutanoate/2-iminopropanoate deaminase|nr:Rid family hydrolase [uncultured Acidaminococcus sp.]